MSASQEHDPVATREHKAERRGAHRERTRAIAMILLAILITVFAVLNLSDVKVNWIIGSGHAPLIVVIVISLLVGIFLTYIANRANRANRGKG